MILVTTGTNGAPFDRLLAAVDLLETNEPAVVQYGPSSIRPHGARCVAYVSFDELVGLVRTARIVITHAGVGSILVALANGKRPVVVPRLARFREAVDDHQLLLAERLAQEKLITLVKDADDLGGALAAARASAISTSPVAAQTSLGNELADYLRQLVRQPSHGS